MHMRIPRDVLFNNLTTKVENNPASISLNHSTQFFFALWTSWTLIIRFLRHELTLKPTNNNSSKSNWENDLPTKVPPPFSLSLWLPLPFILTNKSRCKCAFIFAYASRYNKIYVIQQNKELNRGNYWYKTKLHHYHVSYFNGMSGIKEGFLTPSQ